MPNRLALLTTFSAPDIIDAIDDDDATLYSGGERDDHIYDLLDTDNDCEHPGGHVLVGDCGAARCVHCKRRVG